MNRPRLKYHMDYCTDHPEELSRVAGLQRKVDEVKNVMVDNIEQVLSMHGSQSPEGRKAAWRQATCSAALIHGYQSIEQCFALRWE